MALKKKTRTSTKRALKSRGGFSGGLALRPMRSANVNDNIGDFIRSNANKSKNPKAAAAGYLAKLAMDAIAVKVGGAIVKKVSEAPLKESESNGETTTATIVQKVTGRRSNSSTVGRVYKVKFDAGQAPTSTVYQTEKLNGASKFTQDDTSVDIGDTATREELGMYYGFNRKDFYWYNDKSYWSYGDLQTLSGIATYNLENEFYQKCYWLTKHFGTKITLLNKNSFLKTNIKIHLLRQTDLSYTATSAFNEFCHPTVATPQNLGHIPVKYQLSDRITGAIKSYVSTDPKLTTIHKSSAIKNLFDVVYTHSATLEPGETLEFDYRHHTGSGIRMDKLQYTSVDSGTFNTSAPAFYYPVIELVGPTVECIDSIDTNRSWIGTASGAVQVAFKKYAEIVQGAHDINDYLDATSGFEAADWAFKIYSSPSPSLDTTNKRFNVPYNDILAEGGTPAIGKYIIPVATDTIITQGGKSNLG